MNGHWVLQAFSGILLGAVGTGSHLLLLSKHLGDLQTLEATKARAAVLRGLPLRLIVWAPVILLALHVGWIACLAMITTGIAIRWTMLYTSAMRVMAD